MLDKIQYLPNATQKGDKGSLLYYYMELKSYFSTTQNLSPVEEKFKQLFNDSRFVFYLHQTGQNINTTGMHVHAKDQAHLASRISHAEILVVPTNPKEINIAYGFLCSYKDGWSEVMKLDELSPQAQEAYRNMMEKNLDIEQKVETRISSPK